MTHSQSAAMETQEVGQSHFQTRCAADKADMIQHRLRSSHSRRTLLTAVQPNICQSHKHYTTQLSVTLTQ